MKKIILIIAMLFISGCSSVAVLPEKVITEDFKTNILHKGDMYAADINLEINAGETVYIKALTNESVHLIERRVYAVTETGNILDYDIKIFEGGTDTSSSNILNNFNVNREIGVDNSTFRIYMNVSGVNLNNSLELPFGQSEISDKRYSTSKTSVTEYILKSNTNYYMAITNNDGGILSVNIFWEFYEE